MTYYHNLITEKSWKYLQELKKKHDFILIGGWAVYLYTKALKSKDIDFICGYTELEKLKTEYELIKNDRLKKYEIHIGEFDIDIYVPFFSDLGVPITDLQSLTHVIDGITVLEAEALLILKQHAHESRAGSAKGEKDKIDIIALLLESVDIKKYKKILSEYNLEYYKGDLKRIIGQIREVPELDLKEHKFAKFKKRILNEL